MHNKKVLVVDDSPYILDLIKDALTTHGYEVDTADNGAQALDKYAKFQPDIVTLDISMPVMDGYETMSRMLKLDPNAWIIMLTALESEALLARCLEKGARGYLTKPFRKEELIDTITRVFTLDCDKHVTAFFAEVRNKLERSIKELLDSSASITLKDVRVDKKERPVQTLSPSLDLSQIKSVPTAVQEFAVEKPEGVRGYISEFSGQQNGMILSFIDEKHLDMLTNRSEGMHVHYDLEFFNILNMKVLSELANVTHLILNIEPARLYDGTKDKSVPANEVAKARFEIIYHGKSVSIEIQIWVKIGGVF